MVCNFIRIVDFIFGVSRVGGLLLRNIGKKKDYLTFRFQNQLYSVLVEKEKVTSFAEIAF
jgi:hypothetical protein